MTHALWESGCFFSTTGIDSAQLLRIPEIRRVRYTVSPLKDSSRHILMPFVRDDNFSGSAGAFWFWLDGDMRRAELECRVLLSSDVFRLVRGGFVDRRHVEHRHHLHDLGCRGEI